MIAEFPSTTIIVFMNFSSLKSVFFYLNFSNFIHIQKHKSEPLKQKLICIDIKNQVVIICSHIQHFCMHDEEIIRENLIIQSTNKRAKIVPLIVQITINLRSVYLFASIFIELFTSNTPQEMI